MHLYMVDHGHIEGPRDVMGVKASAKATTRAGIDHDDGRLFEETETCFVF